MGPGRLIPATASFHCNPHATGMNWTLKEEEPRGSFFSGTKVKDPLLAFLSVPFQAIAEHHAGAVSEATAVCLQPVRCACSSTVEWFGFVRRSIIIIKCLLTAEVVFLFTRVSLSFTPIQGPYFL